MNKCIYCQSENLERGLVIRGSREIGHLHFEGGIDFDKMEKEKGARIPAFAKKMASSLATVSQPETIYADLCRDCGSISRFYIKNKDATLARPG